MDGIFVLSKLRKQLSKMLGGNVVELVDVGARGGVVPHWRWISPKLHLTMFEPDPAAASELRNGAASQGLDFSVIESAVWSDRSKHLLKLTRSGGCSSLLEPNRDLLNEFPANERFDILKQFELDTNALDDILKSNISYDFLKIDVQGGSLMVLEGAKKSLDGLFGMEIEAEMIEMYKGEPLFGVIHEHVAAKGFELVDIRPTYWQRRTAQNIPGCRGQAISSDMLYMISPKRFADRMEGLSSSDVLQSLGRLLICCSVYGLEDWMVSYITICKERALIDDNDLIHQIERRCRRGGIFARLPTIPGQMGLCMLLRDIAFQLDRNGGNWVYQDNTLGNMPRMRWTNWMRP
jgi:FkbM family methyltransferase